MQEIYYTKKITAGRTGNEIFAFFSKSVIPNFLREKSCG